jgi:hypothetical protein
VADLEHRPTRRRCRAWRGWTRWRWRVARRAWVGISCNGRRRRRARRGWAWWRVGRRAWVGIPCSRRRCRARRCWAWWRRVAWRAWVTIPCHTAEQSHHSQGGKLTTRHLLYGISPRQTGRIGGYMGCGNLAAAQVYL